MTKKRFIVIIMSMVLVLIYLTGCGKGNDSAISVIVDNYIGNETRTEEQSVQYKTTEQASEADGKTEIESHSETQIKVSETVKEKPKPTVVPTQKPTVASITKEKAYVIAKEAIHKYDIYGGFYMCCDYEMVDVWLKDYMAAEQRTWALSNVRCTCCKTSAQLEQHILKYLDKSFILRDVDEITFTYNGSLYVGVLPCGYSVHDPSTLEIVSYNSNQIVAKCVEYDMGTNLGTTVFTLKNNGTNYVITNASK